MSKPVETCGNRTPPRTPRGLSGPRSRSTKSSPSGPAKARPKIRGERWCRSPPTWNSKTLLEAEKCFMKSWMIITFIIIFIMKSNEIKWNRWTRMNNSEIVIQYWTWVCHGVRSFYGLWGTGLQGAQGSWCSRSSPTRRIAATTTSCLSVFQTVWWLLMVLLMVLLISIDHGSNIFSTKLRLARDSTRSDRSSLNTFDKWSSTSRYLQDSRPSKDRWTPRPLRFVGFFSGLEWSNGWRFHMISQISYT